MDENQNGDGQQPSTALTTTPTIPTGNIVSQLSGRGYPLHNGARQLIQYEEKCLIAEGKGLPLKGGRVRFDNRVYRYILETIDDPTYQRGEYIQVTEIALSKKVFNSQRVRDGNAMKKREQMVKAALPAVIHAYNFYWQGLNGTVLVQKMDSDGKVLGICYPDKQEDIDRYMSKLNVRAAIAQEQATTTADAIKALPAAKQPQALPTPAKDETDKVQ